MGNNARDSPSPMLPSWWAKVKRAQEHRETLEQYISETFAVETNLPTFAVKFDADTSQHVLYVKRTPDLSEFYSRVGLIFGDCINNFRSALDHLVYEMGMRNTAKTGGLMFPRMIKFPIVNNSKDWKGYLGKELKEVSEQHQIMIERFQPYHKLDLERGALQGQIADHPLVMLRELTDIDKHRVLTAVGVPYGHALAVRFIGTAMLLSGECQIMHGNYLGLPVARDAEIWRAKLPDNVPKDEVDMAGHVNSLVTLIEAHKQPVLPLIDTLATTVDKILRELEPTL